jgi:hypothetical protein
MTKWSPNLLSHDNSENKDLVATISSFLQLVEFISQGSETTMISFMGPPSFKKIYRTLSANRLQLLLTYIFEYIKYVKE